MGRKGIPQDSMTGVKLAFGRLLMCALFCAAFLGPAAAAERVVLRAGEHKGFSRLVFDWENAVGYTTAVAGGQLAITFDRPAELDLVEIEGGALSRVAEPQLSEADGKMVLRFKVHPAAAVRDFRDGAKVVIDIADPPTNKADAPPPASASGGKGDAQANGRPAPQPVKSAARAEPQPDKAGRSAPLAAKKTPPSAREAPLPEPKSAAADLKYTGTPVALQYEPIFNGVRFSYPLSDPLPAAAFVRAGYLWVVFEKYRPVDQDALNGVLGERIKSAEQIANPLATILRYRIADGQSASAHRRGSTWVVELKDNRTSPQIPIDIGLQDENGERSVFMPITDVGSRIDINDPAVGDLISVVPVLAPGRGIAEKRRFAKFEIAPTAQGIVVKANADDVDVARFRNGVAITASDGLMVSDNSLASVMDEPDPSTTLSPRRLVDFKAWRRGGPEDYIAVRQNLFNRLSQMAPKDRNSVRWDLARFYLGHGLPDQSLGILDVMAASDEGLLDNAEFRAARGIALAMLRRYEEARNDLAYNGLDSEMDAYLWRAVVAEGMGDWEAALSNYERGADILKDYDDADAARFRLVALRSAFELGRKDVMEMELTVLSGLVLPPQMTAEVEFLRAKALAAEGQLATARETLNRVIATGDRGTVARARLFQLELKLDKNEIPPADAIEQLERLRFAWRGDDFELNLLDRLGRLYMVTEGYRTGLTILRQAVTYFDKSPRTRKLSDLMSSAFRELFLNGKADSMPPIDALALYYDFRELTPLGSDGDNMIRRLADRLVSVDLLERAAELLEHQVRYRLEGVAQADVAARLAMIYLLDRKPEKALAVIRATRQTVIPEDVETRRQRLEARALIDLGQFEEAEVLLDKDTSREADLLRADLYWGASRWSDVVANADKLLGRRWEVKKALSNDERRQILRMGVALSLAENIEGIRDLRRRYGGLMADGAYSAAFDVITAKQDPSAKEIKELTESIASVNTLEGFMSAYRKEFRGS